MKRQADGVSCVSEEVEKVETNGNKRIKLLSEANSKIDGTDKKLSGMDVSLNECSENHSHENNNESILNNGSSCEQMVTPTEKGNTDDHPIKSSTQSEPTENGNFNPSNNCNGSHDEAVIKVTATDSAEYFDINIAVTDDNTESEPPVLNHCDHDLHNSESTDSFQSENFEAHSLKGESKNEVPEAHTIQEENDDHVKDFSFEADCHKSYCDVDNLTTSFLKVTELKGHTDSVFSVAADEEFILSSSADTTVKVWNVERQSIVSTFSGHSSTVTSLLLLNPNQSKNLKKKMSLTKVSRIAITGSLDCHIKLWSVSEGKELASVYTFNGITCLGYLESECLVVVGTEGGKLELWNLSAGKEFNCRVSIRAHEDAVTDIKVKENYIYSVSVDGTVKVWSFEDDDIYPVYTRKRKEISSDKSGFKPAEWNSVAVLDNVMYLGDNSSSIKILDWRIGRLSLFKNQSEDLGVCNSVVIKENMLFSSFYNTSTAFSGINVWKLPEMSYVCSITGVPFINSLAVVEKDNKLKVIAGGQKLFICEFDFSRPPSSGGEFTVCELETLGDEINEKPVEIKSHESKQSSSSTPKASNSTSTWQRCNIM